ncbi:hypothetical protein Zmor_001652 [Zophobas morio]|uniref:DUF7041 domain-containing protein n=1 Tax=Zophobas morio TaxID=2755281 RepID=A0AA38J4A2_9CUCU|nr:hypothetical protein Zmor_001652 [Zophobas morio]
MHNNGFRILAVTLPPDVAAEVSDVILKPHDTEPYTRLKQAIVSRTCITETQRLKQLLRSQELGSRKPSQLLRHMQSLIQNTPYVNATALRGLFVQQMPVSIQPILVSLTEVEIDKVAKSSSPLRRQR